MARPLMQHGVGQLEEMFAKGKADPKVLKQLENELQYRQVPRAIALLAEVQAATCGGTPAAPQVATVPAPPVVAAPTAAPFRTVTPAAKPPQPASVVKAPASPPVMPVDDAYKVLNASPGATWESLEQTRRTLVQQSHPSRWKTMSTERRAQALAEAERVSAAYAALSHARCGGR